MSEKVCPNCGKTSEAGMNYCMYCGTKLEEKPTPLSEEKKETSMGESTQEIPETLVEEDKIPQDIRTQLELRAKLEEIIGETSVLKGEIDRLMEELSGEISIEEYKNKIKVLKSKVVELKKEREDVESLLRPLPLEQVAKEKEELKERLTKLKEVYRAKEISDETFERLRKEYESEFEKAKKKHKVEKEKVKNWIAQLEKDRKKIQEELELLYARYKTGEIPEEEYQKNKDELKKELNRTQISLENLRIEIRQWG